MRYLHPRYWLTWLALGLLYLSAKLPFRAQLSLGRGLGKLFYWFAPYRRHIAATNLKLCFPELNAQQQINLLKETFAAIGTGVIEAAISWWASDKKIRALSQIEGLEHLRAALQKNNGVILLAAHFTTLELAGRIVGLEQPICCMYRPQKNRLFNAFTNYYRKRNTAGIIPRDDIRTIIKTLKQNQAIYYAADQDYGKKHSIFVPFFGIPAATIMATIRLANINQSPIVPVFHYREKNSPYYRVIFLPALENFPSGDNEKDLLRINQLIESAIRHKPEQYLWIHRRFKTRPPGEPRPYDGVIKN